MTGVDNSPGCIKICKLKGLKQAKILDLEDLDKLQQHSFNTILFMDNDFGLLCTKAKIERVLKKINRIMAKNGRIIVQNLEPYLTKNQDQLAYHKFNVGRRRIRRTTLRARYKNTFGQWFGYLFSSISEVTKSLQGTGFKIQQTFTPTERDYVLIIKRASECSK